MDAIITRRLRRKLIKPILPPPRDGFLSIPILTRWIKVTWFSLFHPGSLPNQIRAATATDTHRIASFSRRVGRVRNLKRWAWNVTAYYRVFAGICRDFQR